MEIKKQKVALGGGVCGALYGFAKVKNFKRPVQPKIEKFLEYEGNDLYLGKGHIRLKKVGPKMIRLTNESTGLEKELCLKDGYTINRIIIDDRKTCFRSCKFYLPKIRDFSLDIETIKDGEIIVNTVWLTDLK